STTPPGVPAAEVWPTPGPARHRRTGGAAAARPRILAPAGMAGDGVQLRRRRGASWQEARRGDPSLADTAGHERLRVCSARTLAAPPVHGGPPLRQLVSDRRGRI